MRKAPILVGLIMIVSVGIISGTAAAQEDDWPGQCDEAPIIEPGTVNGVLSTSFDSDMFRVRLQRGQYIDVSTQYSSEKTITPELRFNHAEPDVEFNVNIEIRGLEHGTTDSSGDIILFDGDRDEHRFELWAITDQYSENGICMEIDDRGWETPYSWELTIERSDPDVTLFEVRKLEDRIVELQNQLDDARGNSERVSDLESQLEEKNQRISELESQIQNLESQIDELESQTSDTGGDVAIDVTVNPANSQQNFVEGSEVLVHAESEAADVSEMQVEYGTGTYELDSSGEVTVPLVDSGMQEMTVVYEDTTEKVSIDVQSQSESQQTPPEDGDGTDDSTSDGFGPGLGIVTAAIALLAGALLVARHR